MKPVRMASVAIATGVALACGSATVADDKTTSAAQATATGSEITDCGKG